MPRLSSLSILTTLFILFSPGFVSISKSNETTGETIVHVSPAGPIASLQKAQLEVRKIRASGQATGPIRVIIADGVYRMTEPLVLTQADSGTADSPLIFEAADGSAPVFSGGMEISGMTPDADGRTWSTLVADANSDKPLRFEQLYVTSPAVDDHRAVRAREPDRFYYYTRGKVLQTTDPESGKTINTSYSSLIAEPAIFNQLQQAAGENPEDIVVKLYHSWAISMHRVARLDQSRHALFFTSGAPWPIERWNPSQRWHVENYREALDTPGEWFLGRDGRLTYMPREGETPENTKFIAPRITELIRIEGDREQGQIVRHITFRGLTFRDTAYRLPRGGYACAQGAVIIPGAINLDGGEDIAFEDCEMSHLGGYGIWLRSGCRQCKIVRCYINDLGAGGVRIGETWENNHPTEIQLTSLVTVDNCIIRDGGHTFCGCAGILIGHSPYNTVTHNEIADFRYTGISVGWRWGYDHSDAHHILLESNHIHHIGHGVMSDMGGIYTLGDSPGTVLRGNVIHDVYDYGRYGRGGWGLYNDQASVDIVMENNLVYRTNTGGYHLHFGKDLVVRNNIFACSVGPQLQFSRAEEHHSVDFTGNIVWWQSDQPLYNTWRGVRVKLADNVIYNAGREVSFNGVSLAEWQKQGNEIGTIIADPKFVDPAADDYRLQEDSPAIAHGFKPFDPREAGVYGDPAWKQLAAQRTWPDYEPAPNAPPPPPLTIDDDFELAGNHAVPIGATVYHENRKHLIRTVDQSPAEGKRCLRVGDAPDLQHSYDPHFFFKTGHISGQTRVSFYLKVEEGVHFMHEWRDMRESPYRIIASIRIKDGQLIAAGRPLKTTDDVPLPIVPGRWYKFDLSATIGAPTWNLQVTDQETKVEITADLPVARTDWKQIDWIGFCNLEKGEAAFYLDRLVIENNENADQ